MSDVNLNFAIEPVQANVIVTTNDISFTPAPINMTFYTGTVSTTVPKGVNGAIQYNNDNVAGGINTLTSNGTVTTVNDIANLKIGGGSANYMMKTDGTGNLAWVIAPSGYAPGGANTYIQYNNGISFSGSANYTYNVSTDTVASKNNTVSGNLTIQRAMEKVTGATFATGIQFDVLTQSVINFTTNCSSNFTVNFRGDNATSFDSVIAINQCMTFAFLVTNGTPAYYLTTVTIDGTTQSVKWLGGAPIAGFVNSKEMYNFNIIKTAAGTYTVLGSRGVYS
jgi:hypothetical protein